MQYSSFLANIHASDYPPENSDSVVMEMMQCGLVFCPLFTGNGMRTICVFASTITHNHLTSTELLAQFINPLSTTSMDFTKCLLTYPYFSASHQPNTILVSHISLLILLRWNSTFLISPYKYLFCMYIMAF